MTQTDRSISDTLDEHANMGMYAALALACGAFAGMLLAPFDHAELLLILAWVCMLGAMVCLVGKMALGLFRGPAEDGITVWRTPQQ